MKQQIAPIIETTAKVLLSNIPIGNAFIVLYDCVKGNFLEKRLSEWQGIINERLKVLEDYNCKEININDSFSTSLVRATEIAVKNNTIKKKYLANAVFNSLNGFEEEELLIFFNIIEKYTILHFFYLLYYRNPSKYVTSDGTIKNKYMSEMYRKHGYKLTGRIKNDLIADGLVSKSKKNNYMTTPLGLTFIDFFGIDDSDYE